MGTDRIERLLVLLLLQGMKGATQRDKAKTLQMAGFQNSEIAEFIEASAATVSQYLYEARLSKKAKPKSGKLASPRRS